MSNEMSGEFKILCDRCGQAFVAQPAYEAVMPVGSVTVSAVEYCPFCVGQARPVSHRTLFLIKVVNELEQLKKCVGSQTDG